MSEKAKWKFRLFKQRKDAKTEAQIQRKGERARNFLRSESYIETMQDLEEGIWKQFMSTEADSPESREVLYQHLTALKHIHAQLEQSVAAGETSKQIEEEKESYGR